MKYSVDGKVRKLFAKRNHAVRVELQVKDEATKEVTFSQADEKLQEDVGLPPPPPPYFHSL